MMGDAGVSIRQYTDDDFAAVCVFNGRGKMNFMQGQSLSGRQGPCMVQHFSAPSVMVWSVDMPSVHQSPAGAQLHGSSASGLCRPISAGELGVL